MKPANSKIIVSVDYEQKSSISIGGTNMLLAKDFSTNYREKNPVICKVIEGSGHIGNGSVLLVHHGRFVEGSPHYLGNNLYSIAWNESVFAKIQDGEVVGINGNIIVKRVHEANPLIPTHLLKANKHKYIVVNGGHGYKKGREIFAFPFADYEIVYVWEGVEKRVVKIINTDIVGVVVK